MRLCTSITVCTSGVQGTQSCKCTVMVSRNMLWLNKWIVCIVKSKWLKPSVLSEVKIKNKYWSREGIFKYSLDSKIHLNCILSGSNHKAQQALGSPRSPLIPELYLLLTYSHRDAKHVMPVLSSIFWFADLITDSLKFLCFECYNFLREEILHILRWY